MVQIIARYITKEICKAFGAMVGILLLIVLSNRFVHYLAKAATGDLPIQLVLNVVGLTIPELLSYLVPLSLFIAILLTYGRLYVDSEMAVLASCGISPRYLLTLTLLIALMWAMVTAMLTLGIVPKAAMARERTLVEGELSEAIQSLTPKRFQTFSEGKFVFYMEGKDPKQSTLKGIFIAEKPKDLTYSDKGWALLTAKAAYIKPVEKNKNSYLILKNGYRYQGLPGTANYTVIAFKEYGRKIPKATEFKPTEELRAKATRDLKTAIREEAAELQWRLSLPLSVLILSLIAVPLSRINPRQGRFAKLLPAILLYILYYNLFTICRRWVASGTLPSFVGVWWVHGLFLLIGIGLIGKDVGWFSRAAHGNS